MSTRAIRHLPLKITNMVSAVKDHNVNAPRQGLRTFRARDTRPRGAVCTKVGGLDAVECPPTNALGPYWAIGAARLRPMLAAFGSHVLPTRSAPGKPRWIRSRRQTKPFVSRARPRGASE